MKKNKITLIITILLFAVAAYFITTQRKGTIYGELRDFAIKDTASITKIFLADKMGGSSTVVKESPGKWIVNGKYPVRVDAINNLLETVKSLEVRSPVAKAAYNNILKQIAAKGIKVEIYQHDKLTKTYYVGNATMDVLGTYMLMEKSSVPFVLFIPGFDGYLTPRYITSETEWKIKNVFDTKPEEIASLISEDFENTENSFMITRQDKGEMLLTSYPGKTPVPDIEQNKLYGYLSGFTFVGYEGQAFDDKAKLDSIKQSGPFRAMTLTDSKNQVSKIRFYHMPVSEKSKQIFDLKGDFLPFDQDRMLAVLNNDTTFVTVQYYVFGKLFKVPDDFKAHPVRQEAKK